MPKTKEWSPAAIERKRRVIANQLGALLSMYQNCHPSTGKPCTRQEAIRLVRSLQVSVLQSMEQKHGHEISARYRGLIDEVLSQFQRQAYD